MIRRIYRKIRANLTEDLILIFQMGKVGSTSVLKSLGSRVGAVKHIHSIIHPINFTLMSDSKFIRKQYTHTKLLKYQLHWKLLLPLIRRNKTLKIISMVRNPVARNISFYFQNLPYFLLAVDYDEDADTCLVEHTNIDALQKMFFEKFNHNHGINWFDCEIKKAFGIDVYKYPFDKDKGFTIFKDKNIEVMIVQMEKMNQLENQISDFLSIEDFKIVKENEGDKKWYSCVYKQFCENIVYPIEYIDSQYNSKFMKHFYSTEDIGKFRAKYAIKL